MRQRLADDQILTDLRLLVKFDGAEHYTIEQSVFSSLEHKEGEIQLERLDRELVCAFVYGLPSALKELPMIQAVIMLLEMHSDEFQEIVGDESFPTQAETG